MPSLFDSYKLGNLMLKNRIVMAPMTRSRSPDLSPSAATVLYYQQRASAGLIVTEGAPISEESRGQAFTPGIYTPDQINQWKKVTEAVHSKGGVIFMQLWHVGRASHVSLQPGRGAPVSSVAKRGENQVAYAFDENGEARPLPQSEPRALATEEVPRVTRDFVQAAKNAMTAGFDGIEIHGANGYIFEQFINGALNNRTDRYGGSIENRIRFALETVDAIAAAIGKEKVGIRLAPYGRFGDMHAFHDEEETWLTMAKELSSRNIAYVHISDQHSLGQQAIPKDFTDKFREAYRGTLIVAGGYDKESGQRVLDTNRADLIAIGRPFIANPDLVERMKNGWPLAEPDRKTFYGGGEQGYVDYPFYED